jgi:pyridoxamine 5'-phosphate oxidase
MESFAMTENMPTDPLELFHSWYAMAETDELNDPDAMALATATKDGKPSVRMVLLKEADARGFKFHTNCESDKGLDLAENPVAALCFHWKSLRKQVRIEGSVAMASTEEADAYFAGRPYARQIGAWASQQSRPLESREILENKIAMLQQQYPVGSVVPRPAYWVGYRVIPVRIEFWLGHDQRLHDRFIYVKNKDTWDIQRLYP